MYSGSLDCIDWRDSQIIVDGIYQIRLDKIIVIIVIIIIIVIIAIVVVSSVLFRTVRNYIKNVEIVEIVDWNREEACIATAPFERKKIVAIVPATLGKQKIQIVGLMVVCVQPGPLGGRLAGRFQRHVLRADLEGLGSTAGGPVQIGRDLHHLLVPVRDVDSQCQDPVLERRGELVETTVRDRLNQVAHLHPLAIHRGIGPARDWKDANRNFRNLVVIRCRLSLRDRRDLLLNDGLCLDLLEGGQGRLPKGSLLGLRLRVLPDQARNECLVIEALAALFELLLDHPSLERFLVLLDPARKFLASLMVRYIQGREPPLGELFLDCDLLQFGKVFVSKVKKKPDIDVGEF